MGYIGWMVFGVVLLVIEIVTPTFFFLWFSIGAFLAGVVDIMNLGLAWQIGTFTVVSVVLVFLTRPIAKKISGTSPRKTYIEEIEGITGRVVEEINANRGKGIIRIGGEDWRAFSVNPQVIIRKDAEVIVKKLDGTVVYVEPVEKE